MKKVSEFLKRRRELRRSIEKSQFYEKFMDGLDEKLIYLYMGISYISISTFSAKGIIALRKRFHDFDLTMDDAGSVGFIGEHYSFPESKDIISIFFSTYFDIPESKLKGNIDVNYYMHEKDLPAEFVKKGCGFKDVETIVKAIKAEPQSIKVKRAFVCN